MPGELVIKECFVEKASGCRIIIGQNVSGVHLAIMQPRNGKDDELDQEDLQAFCDKIKRFNTALTPAQEEAAIKGRKYMHPLPPDDRSERNAIFDRLALAGIILPESMRERIHAIAEQEVSAPAKRKPNGSRKPIDFVFKDNAPDTGFLEQNKRSR